MKTRKCPVCGTEFDISKNKEKKTCSRSCAGKLSAINFPERKCELCGKMFKPTSSMSRYCDGPHYKPCEVCGKDIAIPKRLVTNPPRCCSTECSNKLRKNTCLERYGVSIASQNPETREKLRERALDSLESKKQTCLERYGVDNVAKLPEVKEKIRSKIVSPEFKKHMESVMQSRYGCSYGMQSSELRKKHAMNSSKVSSLELRLHNFLDEYEIEYQPEYVLSSDNYTHAFDVYLPKYKILIDCDGIWYHGYLSDPDGGWVLPDNDTKRLDVVPKDHIFKVIVEDDFERGLRDLQNTIKSIDEDVFDYEGDMFKWCRSIKFPYPRYTEERIRKDYNRLCNLSFEDIKLRNWSGLSTIRQFHRSLWKDKVKGHKSVYQAWHDDELLKKVIANRIIYVDNVDPSKVLNGFNISKIAPRVSIFNPVLARYLIQKYLDEYPVIFDPFSGYSGRLLGAASAGKCYIGQDLNEDHVRESNQIIQFHNLQNCMVTQKDVLESHESYSCLFTCPPYGDLEIYLEGQVIKSCDDWIDICLKNFKCDKYLFVVNETEKYKDNVVEEIGYTSYFRNSKELVILI